MPIKSCAQDQRMEGTIMPDRAACHASKRLMLAEQRWA